jgi:hypothetical protein
MRKKYLRRRTRNRNRVSKRMKDGWLVMEEEEEQGEDREVSKEEEDRIIREEGVAMDLRLREGKSKGRQRKV